MVSAVDTGGKQGDEPTFSSIMPLLDDLLELIGQKATADEVGGDSNEDVVNKAKELHARMEEMRKLAAELPGGHVSLAKAEQLEEMLDVEAEKRRATLRAFADTQMDTVDRLNATAESGMITPAIPEKD